MRKILLGNERKKGGITKMTVQDINDLKELLENSDIWLISYAEGLQPENKVSFVRDNHREINRLIKKFEKLEVKV